MFHFIYILFIIPLSDHLGAPHPQLVLESWLCIRNVLINLISEKCLKLTHRCFCFSHDKQETEEVVQLQEGGSNFSSNPQI